MALTVSNYMIQPFFGEDDLPKSASTLLAAVFICGLTWLNCYSMKVTTRLQNVFMVTKVVALMLVILVGIYALSQGTYYVHQYRHFDLKYCNASVAGEFSILIKQRFLQFIVGWK